MNNTKIHKRLSKFLSLVLRHKPQEIHLILDDQGWTDVGHLLEQMNTYGKSLDIETLKVIVETNDKQRFAFNEDYTKIRANQGHSIKIDLGYEPVKPPEILFHGTARRNKKVIFEQGLIKRKRHHVHLSKDLETAYHVGQRHGEPIILEILALEMHQDGYRFFLSENGVWLTNHVPAKYLRSTDEF